MNKVFLIGRLTKDVDVRYTQSGVMSANFTLAVDRRFQNQQGEKQTDFLNIVTWRKTAELCSKYIGKGSQVCVIGRIQVRTYDDQNGNRRWITEIVADEVQFLDRKRQGAEGSDGMTQPFNESELFDNFPSEEDMPF